MRPGAHVGELDLGFLGGERSLAALQDVLFAGAGRLDHLVNGAVAFGEELVREAEGDVIDNLGFLEGEESLVIAARWKQAVRQMGGMGIMGKMFPITRILRIIPILSHSIPHLKPSPFPHTFV